MIVVLVVFLILCLWGARYSRKGNDNYLGKDQTNYVRGAFALIIFMSHFNSYVTTGWTNIGDGIYLDVFSKIGQMMVAPFLFVSGYGIYLSSRKKKENYVRDFPKNRILKTYLFFALAVLVYLLFNLITHREYSARDTLLAFAGWTSIGNSNWFMFAILFSYIATYFSALMTKKTICIQTIAITYLLSVAYIIIMCQLKPGQTWWYDTILCFPVGMLVAHFSDKLSKFFKKRRVLSLLLSSALFAILFILTRKLTNPTLYPYLYNLLSCSLCFMLARLLFSFSIGNKILQFLGTYGFEIYILQRIPHSVFGALHLRSAPLFFFLSLLTTLLLSLVFKVVTDWLCRVILSERTRKS